MKAKSSPSMQLSELAVLGPKVSIKFQLKLEPGEEQYRQGQAMPSRDACVEVLLNGREFDFGVDWDLLAIVASGRGTGGYYLGNCDCGNPDCAGISKPILVRHLGHVISWEIPIPYVSKGSAPNAENPAMISFNMSDYRVQAEALLSDLRRAANDGGPLIRLKCYLGELPTDLLERAEGGWAGHGGRGPIWVTKRLF